MQNYCAERNKCFSFCTSDNFPDLKCHSVEMEITYNNNAYYEFFTYPNPQVYQREVIQDKLEMVDVNYYKEWNEEKQIRNRYTDDILLLTSQVIAEFFFDENALEEQVV